ncbi:MAG: zinc ribbon domain-containing protein [Methanomicrobiales archaeon]|nr:zinc ribbon domain-containing protein [Methanomicrobiales archaeon]
MAQENFCSKCGAARKQGTLFCSQCGAKYPATPQAAAPAPAAGLTCKACGNPLKPGDKFCSKCLVKAPDSVAAAPAAAKMPAQPAAGSDRCRRCGAPIPPGDINCRPCFEKIQAEIFEKVGINPPSSRPAPAQTQPAQSHATHAIPVQSADTNCHHGTEIPAVECFTVEVVRNADAASSFEGNLMVTTMVCDNIRQDTVVTPSMALLEYPQLEDTKVDDQSGLFKEARITFTQKERMTCIIDADGKTIYCLFAPENQYLPINYGVLSMLFTMGNHRVSCLANPIEWAKHDTGDFLKNFQNFPSSGGRDYASYFNIVPLATEPKKAAGLFGTLGALSKGVQNFSLNQYAAMRDPVDKLESIAMHRQKLTALLTSPEKTVDLGYRQKICGKCGNDVIYDPAENALYCTGCDAYVQRLGNPPWHDYYIKNMEKTATIMKPPATDYAMMHRSAYCPVCAAQLKYIYLQQWAEYGTPGNHIWFCPHCLEESPQVMDHPVNIPVLLTCSICGKSHPSLADSDVTICPSCGAQLMSADWEKRQPMPQQSPNAGTQWGDFPWSSLQRYQRSEFTPIQPPEGF